MIAEGSRSKRATARDLTVQDPSFGWFCVIVVVMIWSWCTNQWTRLVFSTAGLLTVIGAGVAFCWLRSSSYSSRRGGPSYVSRSRLSIESMRNLVKQQLRLTDDEMAGYRERPRVALFSRSLDDLLVEIIERLVDDYFRSWYTLLSFDAEPLSKRVSQEIWEALRRLKKRLSAFDEVNFIANNVLNKLTLHFRTAQSAEDGVAVDLSYLRSSKSEQEFLCCVSDVLLSILLPANYCRCQLLRQILREIFACKVFLPVIEYICAPDTINMLIHDYFEGVQMWSELHEKTYSYAASYEDFVRVIRQSNDLEELKHIRYSIVSEIMQASMINNLKRSRGIKLNRDLRPLSSSKGDLLQARNLKRYINQLSYAKTQCEKRIKSLGGTDYLTELVTPDSRNSPQLVGKKFLSFGVIMESAYTRRYFRRYLETESQGRLLDFWCRVNELRRCPKQSAHAIGGEIYQLYLTGRRGVVKLDRVSLKRIENFLIGDRGPDIFYELQDEVQLLLENTHYHRFLVSSLYNKMMVDAEESGIDFINATVAGLDCDQEIVSDSDFGSTNLADHSSFAALKLDQLNERIGTKVHALEAMRAASNADEKMIALIEQEIRNLTEERCEWEAHIERTDLWTEHLGCWSADIHSAEVLDDKDMPVFVLVVYLVSSAVIGSDAPSRVEQAVEALDGREQRAFVSILDHHRGWVVIRRLSDVRQLHNKLCEISPNLKSHELPVLPGKSIFSKNCDQAYLDRAKLKVQKYLNFVLADERLNKSELIYTFLSPSSERLLFPGSASKKLSFFTVLKSVTKSGDDEAEPDSDDDLLFLGNTDASRTQLRDDFAEPLYNLIAEVFDLSGKWLRKSLIVFVQLAYNQTISLRIRDIITWCFSESQIQVYLTALKGACWPAEKISGGNSGQVRSQEQMESTRRETRQLLLENLPETMVNLLGMHNARLGTLKVFDILQDLRLNKQLVYSCLEELLQGLIPELTRPHFKLNGESHLLNTGL